MKFEIFQSEKNTDYFFRLKARNGETILASQNYSSKDSALKGIRSVQNNCGEKQCYEKRQAANGKFHFNLKAKNGQIIGSSQMYSSRATMNNGIRVLKRVAPQARLIEL